MALTTGGASEKGNSKTHPRLAIVSSTLAKLLFPHADAFGQHIRFGVMPDLQDMEIVGIANDARVFDLRDASIPVVYLPVLKHPNYTQWGDLFVRTSEPPEALAKAVDHEIKSLGREYPLQIKNARASDEPGARRRARHSHALQLFLQPSRCCWLLSVCTD
jgi:hypothetical protein